MTDAKSDAILRDPRSRRVNRPLGRAGPGLQQLYRDGCRVVDDALVLETAVNVVGNCAREIESGVREVLAEITLEHSDAAIQLAYQGRGDLTTIGRQQPPGKQQLAAASKNATLISAAVTIRRSVAVGLTLMRRLRCHFRPPAGRS